MRRILLGCLLLGCGPDPRERDDPRADPHGGHAAHGDPVQAAGAPAVEVTPAVAQALGIRTAAARKGPAQLQGRAPVTVSYDPSGTVAVTSWLGGRVDALMLPRVGEPVLRDAPLARVWSPELHAAMEELLVAWELGEPWVGAARRRVERLGAAPSDITRALADGVAPDRHVVRAPVDGVVARRAVEVGGWLAPGGVVAVIARTDALQVDMVALPPLPPVGATVDVEDPGSGASWPATVLEHLPTAEAGGRHVRLAVSGQPPVGRPLIATWQGEGAEGTWVPRGALVDTGVRRVVFVESAPGRFVAREVRVGARTAEEVQIVEGLAPGERVAASGTFLLDSETQLGELAHVGH